MDAMDQGIRVVGGDLELTATESGSHATTACWRRALDNVVPACVVLKYGSGRSSVVDSSYCYLRNLHFYACRVTQTRSFDTEVASSSYATGFVIDKARGIILTNRHVVTPGTLQQ